MAAVRRLAQFSQKTELHSPTLQQTITYDPSFSSRFHLLIYFIRNSFAREYIQNTVCFPLVQVVILTPHCSTSIDTYIAVTSSFSLRILRKIHQGKEWPYDEYLFGLFPEVFQLSFFIYAIWLKCYLTWTIVSFAKPQKTQSSDHITPYQQTGSIVWQKPAEFPYKSDLNSTTERKELLHCGQDASHHQV